MTGRVGTQSHAVEPAGGRWHPPHLPLARAAQLARPRCAARTCAFVFRFSVAGRRRLKPKTPCHTNSPTLRGLGLRPLSHTASAGCAIVMKLVTFSCLLLVLGTTGGTPPPAPTLPPNLVLSFYCGGTAGTPLTSCGRVALSHTPGTDTGVTPVANYLTRAILNRGQRYGGQKLHRRVFCDPPPRDISYFLFCVCCRAVDTFDLTPGMPITSPELSQNNIYTLTLWDINHNYIATYNSLDNFTPSQRAGNVPNNQRVAYFQWIVTTGFEENVATDDFSGIPGNAWALSQIASGWGKRSTSSGERARKAQLSCAVAWKFINSKYPCVLTMLACVGFSSPSSPYDVECRHCSNLLRPRIALDVHACQLQANTERQSSRRGHQIRRDYTGTKCGQVQLSCDVVWVAMNTHVMHLFVAIVMSYHKKQRSAYRGLSPRRHCAWAPPPSHSSTLAWNATGWRPLVAPTGQGPPFAPAGQNPWFCGGSSCTGRWAQADGHR